MSVKFHENSPRMYQVSMVVALQGSKCVQLHILSYPLMLTPTLIRAATRLAKTASVGQHRWGFQARPPLSLPFVYSTIESRNFPADLSLMICIWKDADDFRKTRLGVCGHRPPLHSRSQLVTSTQCRLRGFNLEIFPFLYLGMPWSRWGFNCHWSLLGDDKVTSVNRIDTVL